jgi:hypothetical protein
MADLYFNLIEGPLREGHLQGTVGFVLLNARGHGRVLWIAGQVRGDGRPLAEHMARTFGAPFDRDRTHLATSGPEAAASIGLAATGPITWLRMRDMGAGADNGWDAAPCS